MIRKIVLTASVALALATSAQATIYELGSPTVQQTVPTSNTATGIASTSGTGIWTWDDTTNVVRQTGSNTFIFGPALPGSVGYVLRISNMVIAASGATTASFFNCVDGNFATSFLFASICGGYNFYGPPTNNFVNESTLSADACTRVIGGDDTVTAPTLCITNAFNNGAAGNYALSVRDTSTAGTLKVRDAGFILWGPTSSYGQANAGWEFQFTIVGPLADTDGDAVADGADNCTAVANPTQLDANGDGYGNICDADLNNSNLVTSTDFNLLRSVLNQSAGSSALAAAADMNGSGTVTATDFNLLRARLNSTPGPSSLPCAGTAPCPAPPPAYP